MIHRQIYPEKKKKISVRRSKPLARAVHIDGEEWRWEVTGSRVKILSPLNKYWSIYAGKVATPWTDYQDETLDFKGAVLPSEVKKYIEINLLGRII